MNRTVRLLAAAGLLAAVLAGCDSSNARRDIEGVPTKTPDKVELFANVDEHPNLVMVCIHGVAFVTSTREYGDAVNRVPELDRQCPGAVAR